MSMCSAEEAATKRNERGRHPGSNQPESLSFSFSAGHPEGLVIVRAHGKGRDTLADRLKPQRSAQGRAST